MNKENCLICGAELEYTTTPRMMQCAICGNHFETTAACKNGHFICDDCHIAQGVELIAATCKQTGSKNPIAIMQQLMAQPAIFMHGPEHHVMVGAALLAAYHNCGAQFDLPQAIDEMVRRGKQVPGGACGFWGCCGAAVSAGIFVSIITEATPLKREEWSLSNLMTARALQAIGTLGGPRCCKRDSFTAAKEAVDFVQEHFAVQMELPAKIVCGFSPLNAQCKKEACPYNKNFANVSRETFAKNTVSFVKVNKELPEQVSALSALATPIVREHFDPIIGKAQNDYMLQKFQTVEAITAQLQQGYQYYFVQDLQKKNIGFLAFYPRQQELYLSKFYLQKEQRGHGYAKQMLQFVLQQAKLAGLSAITLNVNRDNPAVRVYEHLGFVKIGEEKNDIGQGFFMDDYVFSYVLPQDVVE